MTQVRFSTVQDLFDAYPSARDDVGAADPDMRSLEFLRDASARQDWKPAMSFCAYLLPRRAAVGWGCRSLRLLAGTLDDVSEKALHFAGSWFDEPDENSRRKALAFGNASSPRLPATWLALAAGWSGGSIVPVEYGHAPAAPEKTAQAVRVALFMALSTLDKRVRDQAMRDCMDDGIRQAGSESVRLR